MENSPTRPNRAPEHFFTLVGAWIVGVVLGDVLYVATGGRLPVATPIMPWWFSALLVCAGLLYAFWETNRWLRAALVLFAAGQVLPFAERFNAPLVNWGLQASAHLGVGILLNVALWPVTRPHVKLVALTLILIAVPVRYWTILNWHSILESRQRKSVELAAPSNRPLQTASGADGRR